MKFPPHTFTTDPIRWTFTAGGSVAHIIGSRSIACERCFATAGPADIDALAAFLHSHAGAVCGEQVKPATKPRRAA